MRRPAFEEIFEENLDFLYNVVRRLGVPAADIADVVQDTFLVVARILDDYDPERPLRPWLCGIAYRLAARHRCRNSQRELAVAELPDAPSERPTPDEDLAGKQTRELVEKALAELTLSHRTVLVLHDIEGMTMKDVVEAVGIPLFTGYSRLRLARAAFREAAQRFRDS